MPIFSILQFIDLNSMTVEINIIKITILIIATIIIIIIKSHKKENVIFIVKKIVYLIEIQIISNRR